MKTLISKQSLPTLTSDIEIGDFYNAKNKTSRRLADWWEEHQEADKKRLKKELKEAKENKDRDTLIAKLTTYEKRLLGI